MFGPFAIGGGCALLAALAQFVKHVLEGKTPLSVCPFFFGANLTALIKRDGRIRPIAVGCTLRRLVAKVASNRVRDDMALLFAPSQLGYGIKRGAEAAVHAARLFLRTLIGDHVVVKLDFNAFNSVRRDKMLTAVRDLVPMLFPFYTFCVFIPFTPFLG